VPVRLAQVTRVEPGWIELEPAPACLDCSGCGGRCGLMMDGERSLRLADSGLRFSAGQCVHIELDSSALRDHAWHGYGWPLLGLLLGAALLQPLGNPAAAAGAVLGTSLALWCSKRPVAPSLRIRPLAAESLPD
jgi:positive regulator of sigma E activity